MIRLFRSPFLSRAIGWAFSKMSFILPLHRLGETDTLLAFHHPRPAYSFHVLIVPRKSVASLADLDPADADFLRDLVPEEPAFET